MSNNEYVHRNEDYHHLETVLHSINGFVKRHKKLTYIEFDYYTTHDLTLFFVEPDFNFQDLKVNLAKINKILPATKRILSKPIIALKDSPEVLPVEIVNKINQNTIQYLGTHLNDVGNITKRGIKPRKLLTQIYRDDYSIYENIIFCNFIDEVMHYCRQNMRILKDLLYASETMEFNLLERVNHLDYFLALGKLHTGYIRDFDKNYDISKELYKEIITILNTIRPRLNKPVYVNNKRRKKLDLKKTNIFLMQKDYHQIYSTYKYFINHKLIAKEDKSIVDLKSLKDNYFLFIKILAIFSLGHFNFKLNENDVMDIKNLDSIFTFKKWTINLLSIKNIGLKISISKNKSYSFLLIPVIDQVDDAQLLTLKDKYNVDEVIRCTPFEDNYVVSKSTLISMENIDSFRRLQQIYLKGMIYSDTKHNSCPFCKGKLKHNQSKDLYECDSCRLVIKKATCEETNKKYYYTLISGLKVNKYNLFSYTQDSLWLYSRNVEGAMFYRNITKLDENGNIVCPHCQKSHIKQKNLE